MPGNRFAAELRWLVADIYLSYRKEDAAYGKRLAKRLKERGWEVQSATGLYGAKCVVVLWSKASFWSDAQRSAAQYGHDDNRLVQARVDDFAVPQKFSNSPLVDLSGWNGDREPYQLEELLEHIADVLRRTTPATAFAPEAIHETPTFRGSGPDMGLEYGLLEVEKRLRAKSEERPRQKNDLSRKTETRPRPKPAPPASAPARSPRVFLCYRRDDTQGESGRLHDHL